MQPAGQVALTSKHLRVELAEFGVRFGPSRLIELDDAFAKFAERRRFACRGERGVGALDSRAERRTFGGGEADCRYAKDIRGELPPDRIVDEIAAWLGVTRSP